MKTLQAHANLIKTDMSRSALKTRVKHLAVEFASDGFTHAGPWRIMRSVPNIEQFIELQPSHSNPEFTCNVCWTLTAHEEDRSGVYDYSVRFDRIAGINTQWLAYEPREVLDSNYAKLVELLHAHVVPFLDTYRELSFIVQQYEYAQSARWYREYHPVNPCHFFGLNPATAHFNLGFSYIKLENFERAEYHLKMVVDSDPNHISQSMRDRSLSVLREWGVR